MTPEELNRTIEFIIASQARLAAAQEQDRQDRIVDRQDRLVFEEWSKGMNARLARVIEIQTELLAHHSERMDVMDKVYQDARNQTERFQQQALHLLHLILDRLPPSASREPS